VRLSFKRSEEAGKDRARLLDFLDENHITVDIRGTTTAEIVGQLAELLYSMGSMPISQEAFVEQVLSRESLETSCLGKGLMIPHTVLKEGSEINGVLGISSEGLHLGAPDRRPVHAVLLLATPESDRTRHLEVLAAFASAITHDLNLREQLYHARSPAHAYNVLHADEAVELNYFLEDAMERAGVASDE
jgi:mannitol/fructose-specific phosphotransferase system IIA component (Ntr-type)